MAKEKKIIELYNGKHVVEFTPSGHTYKVDGERKISVTAITGIVDKPALKFWSVRLMKEYLLQVLTEKGVVNAGHIEDGAKLHQQYTKQAGDTGTLVHEWAEAFIAGQAPPVPKPDEEHANGVSAFLNWVHDFDVQFLESERVVYSKKHDYTGILDCVFTLGAEGHKVKHVGDFKTGGHSSKPDGDGGVIESPYFEHLLQVAGYQLAYIEELGKKPEDFGDRFIIYFKKDTGELRVFEVGDYERDASAFLGLLTAKRRLAETEVKVISKLREAKTNAV